MDEVLRPQEAAPDPELLEAERAGPRALDVFELLEDRAGLRAAGREEEIEERLAAWTERDVVLEEALRLADERLVGLAEPRVGHDGADRLVRGVLVGEPEEDDFLGEFVLRGLAVAREQLLRGVGRVAAPALALHLLVDCRCRKRVEERAQRLVDAVGADTSGDLRSELVEARGVLLSVLADDGVEDLVDERHRRDLGRTQAGGAAALVPDVHLVGEAPCVTGVLEGDVPPRGEEHVVEARGEVRVAGRLPCVHGAHLALSPPGAHDESTRKLRHFPRRFAAPTWRPPGSLDTLALRLVAAMAIANLKARLAHSLRG